MSTGKRLKRVLVREGRRRDRPDAPGFSRRMRPHGRPFPIPAGAVPGLRRRHAHHPVSRADRPRRADAPGSRCCSAVSMAAQCMAMLTVCVPSPARGDLAAMSKPGQAFAISTRVLNPGVADRRQRSSRCIPIISGSGRWQKSETSAPIPR
jgi:hypothetical protein